MPADDNTRSEPLRPSFWGRFAPSFLKSGVHWDLVVVLFGCGAVLALDGAWLAVMGGSPYYVVGGALLIASAVQLIRRRLAAIDLYAIYFVLTWVWALLEVGFDGWALLPRVNLACLLAPYVLLRVARDRHAPDALSERLDKARPFYFWGGLGWCGVVALVVAGSAWMANHGSTPTLGARPALAGAADGEWRQVGQSLAGQKFSGLDQINRDNVKNLRLAWEYVSPHESTQPPSPGQADSGPAVHAGRRDEASPIYADGKLFVCNPINVVTAIDPGTGREIWRNDPNVDTTGVAGPLCRGVAYYEDKAASICPKRIILGTLDLRLLAMDAETGKPCSDFGDNGAASLRAGLGEFETGLIYPTSPPTIVNGIAVIGAMVRDNDRTGEPSGVIRGFDAHTGKLAWAWDMGRPNAGGEPGPGDRYTPGTPNAWTIFAGDEALGLVYVPTGNGTPDYVAGHRDPAWEPYSSAVIAIDVKTGKERWTFQTTHHDLWDYDVGSQPVLYDLPTPEGPVPALIQGTKAGQIFILDRRTGKPLSKVVEKPVPQTDVPGEWTAKTQPYSVDVPDVVGERMRERDMWGISPFDQLFCRLQFKRLRYEGDYTPPSLRGSLVFPGQTGGSDWGGLTIDRARNLLIAPSVRMATRAKLYERRPGMGPIKHTEPQTGTPYLVDANAFLTVLYVPCQAPPYGMLTAIDLSTRKIVWRKPLGTAEELGPRGMKSYLPFTIGSAPLVGGAIATAGDVIFIGAASDRKLRAIDTQTGRVLWSTTLPEGSQATPITYLSPTTGKQMVAIVSGGRTSLLRQNNVPMHVMAFALP